MEQYHGDALTSVLAIQHRDLFVIFKVDGDISKASICKNRKSRLYWWLTEGTEALWSGLRTKASEVTLRKISRIRVVLKQLCHGSYRVKQMDTMIVHQRTLVCNLNRFACQLVTPHIPLRGPRGFFFVPKDEDTGTQDEPAVIHADAPSWYHWESARSHLVCFSCPMLA